MIKSLFLCLLYIIFYCNSIHGKEIEKKIAQEHFEKLNLIIIDKIINKNMSVDEFNSKIAENPETINYLYNLIINAKNTIDVIDDRIFQCLDILKSFNWEKKTKNERLKILKKIPQNFISSTLHFLDYGTRNFDFSKYKPFESIKNELMNSEEINEIFLNIIDKFADNYLNNLKPSNKTRLVLNLLSLNIKATENDKIKIILNFCGPVIQKFFQLLSQKIKSNTIKNLFENLKDKVQPFPFEEVIKIMEANISDSIEKYFSYINETPLASGTIAQAHIAILKDSQKQVVIKVKRPDIILKSKQDLKILRSFIDNEVGISIVNNLDKVINQELSFITESKNIILSKIYSKKNPEIRTVKLSKNVPVTNDLIVMSLASGAPFKQFIRKNDLISKAKLLKKLYVTWLEIALLKNGFFHADLHDGNIFFSPGNKKTKPNITLIDWGSVGKLSFFERKSIVNITLGISIKEKNMIMDGLDSIMEIKECNRKSYSEYVENLLTLKLKPQEKIDILISHMLSKGHHISDNYLQFHRGKTFIIDHIINNNSLLEKNNIKKHQTNIEKIHKKFLLKNLHILFKNIIREKDNPHMQLIYTKRIKKNIFKIRKSK